MRRVKRGYWLKSPRIQQVQGEELLLKKNPEILHFVKGSFNIFPVNSVATRLPYFDVVQ